MITSRWYSVVRKNYEWSADRLKIEMWNLYIVTQTELPGHLAKTWSETRTFEIE